MSVDRLQAFVARGQAAQRAVDQVLAERRRRTPAEVIAMTLGPGPILVDDLPPWKHCDVDGCERWTRGAFCPQDRHVFEPSAGQGPPDGHRAPARTVAKGGGPPAPGRQQNATKHRRR